VVTWYQSQIFDVYAMSGVIRNAPEIPSIAWAPPQLDQTQAPSPPPTTEPPILQTLKPLQETPQILDKSNPTLNPGSNLLLSLIPAVLVVLFIAAVFLIRSRTS